MRSTAAALCLCLLVPTPAPQAPEYSLAILAGTLVDGTASAPRRDVAILVRGETIAMIVPRRDLTRYRLERVIDASRQFVIPGLIDMHTHVTMTHRRFEESNGALRGHITFQRSAAEWVLNEMLRYGVTTVREAGGFLPEAAELQRDLAAGKVTGPRLIIAGPLLEGDTPFHVGMAASIKGDAEARAEVGRQVGLGAQVIKLYSTLSPAAARAAVDAAHERGARVLAHLGLTSWEQALEFGVDDIIHSQHPTSGYAFFKPGDAAATHDLLRRTAHRGVAFTPSLAIARNFLAEPAALGDVFRQAFGRLPPIVRDGWDQQHSVLRPRWKGRYASHAALTQALDERYTFAEDIVRIAKSTGVTIHAGTDCCNINVIPGLSLHQELELLVGAGIPPSEVLRMATGRAAAWLHIDEAVGTLRAGRQADVVILDANPLNDIRNTRAVSVVVQRGKVVPR